MRKLAEAMVAQGADEPTIKLRVEELVRAYDPASAAACIDERFPAGK